MLNYSDPSVFSYESTCFTIMINSSITFLALALTLMHIGESTTTGDPLFTHHITYRVTSITYITSLHTCITVTSHVSHTSLITYMYHCHITHHIYSLLSHLSHISLSHVSHTPFITYRSTYFLWLNTVSSYEIKRDIHLAWSMMFVK